VPRFELLEKQLLFQAHAREENADVGLLTPVFFGLRCERERERLRLGHLELRAAVRARHDLALNGIGADVTSASHSGHLVTDPLPRHMAGAA